MSTVSSDRVAHALAGFPRERQWLLPALHAVQHVLGWLPRTALADVADDDEHLPGGEPSRRDLRRKRDAVEPHEQGLKQLLDSARLRITPQLTRVDAARNALDP